MDKIKTWLSDPTHFTGVLIGAALIFSSLLFLLSGRPLAFNEGLNNIFLALIIIGGFVGIRSWREQQGQGSISFIQALMVGLKILIIAVTFYIVYYACLYLSQPGQVDAFRQQILVNMREIFGTSSPYQLTDEKISGYITPLFIIVVEWLQKVFYGTLFIMLLALILRRHIPPVKSEE